jgi:nucleotide-binding universal stress UspA family protein
VYQVPIAISDAPLVLVSVDELREGAEQQLSKLKEGLEHVTSGQLKIYTEARLGSVEDELQSICEKIQPFAVVMGAVGHSALERTLFGSTTLTAIKHLTWPVIAVPIGKEYGKGIKKLGLAADFREVVDTTPTDVIRNIVKEFSAELHVLNVDYRNKQFRPETPHESALLHAALHDLVPNYHFIEHEDIEDGINEFAEKNNLDLIIAIPKKHKLLQGIFKKSSTRQLVFESRVPVMCVHEA